MNTITAVLAAQLENEKQRLRRAPALTHLEVGMRIVNIENPDWGTWLVSQDRNGWVITARPQGSRMLDIDEAIRFWRLA